MARNIAFLTAAIGLLALTGCGEAPAGGVTVDSAVLTPVAPRPADQNLKPTALPLSPSNETGQLMLSNLTASISPRGPSIIEFDYVFTRGQPNPALSYILVIHLGEGGDPTSPQWMNGGIPISGTEFSQQGHLKVDGILRNAESDQIIQAMLVAAVPSLGNSAAPDGSVKLVSNITGFNPKAPQSGGQAESAPATAPPTAPPANNGGGFLQGLFGGKPAATPPKPPASTSTATNSATSATPSTPAGPNEASSIGDVGQITLSDLKIKHVDDKTIHFDVKYEFTKGQPNPKAAYFVHVDPTTSGTKSYMGGTIDAKGKFSGDMSMRRKVFAFKVYVSAKRPSGDSQTDAANWQGSAISNLLEYPPKAGAAGYDKNSERIVAQLGVGAQGKGYGDGIITTPIAALFSAREKITFDQIKHNMDLFKGLNDRYPNSQEEFDDQIVKESGLTLPELPAGERYFYDPQEHELFVLRPKKPQQ